MSTMTVVEPIVTRVNSCYGDYVKFKKMPKFELDAFQKNCYNELHALQDELDSLLNELRELLHYYPTQAKRSA